MSKLIFFLFFCFIQSEFINLEKAKKVAINKTIYNSPHIDSHEVSSVYTIYEDLYPVIYAVNIKNNGFVLVSADDRVFPVLGYSFSNYYSDANHPIQFENMLNSFKKQISYAIQNNIEANDKIYNEWSLYLSNNIENNDSRSVEPLMSTNWDQGHSWNEYCPEDNQGPGGNAYAGCVATAAAMVMKYWNHPATGQGSYSYNHPEYGNISADFNTVYNWSAMNDNQPTDASRKLLFHVGVSCEMNYSPNGSGAWVGVYEPSLLTGLKTYFKYNSNATFISKDDFMEQEWLDIVKIELDQARPLIYKGYTSDLSAGHAFVIDGYSGDYFHLNWGWSGSYNGNYLINNLSPGGYNFSTWQGAIIQLYPENDQIVGCTDLNACNYNPDANTDNNTCEYIYDCLNICGGSALEDECGVCDGNGSQCSGNAFISFGELNSANQKFDINFESDANIAGFQFTITDVPDNITIDYFSGGFSEDYNFSISSSDLGIVIGFSFEGNIIPYGSGILTTIHYNIVGDDNITNLCLTDVILSNEIGNAINMNVGSCVDLDICTYSGNLNADSLINVQDVIILVNMVITQENIDLCNGDINIDETINIQDIVILMNFILNSGRGVVR
tara:strand:+ start:156 stop:1994 length:1839 start_codon:yes stop_codon:yes gene_type:complete